MLAWRKAISSVIRHEMGFAAGQAIYHGTGSAVVSFFSHDPFHDGKFIV